MSSAARWLRWQSYITELAQPVADISQIKTECSRREPDTVTASNEWVSVLLKLSFESNGTPAYVLLVSPAQLVIRVVVIWPGTLWWAGGLCWRDSFETPAFHHCRPVELRESWGRFLETRTHTHVLLCVRVCHPHVVNESTSAAPKALNQPEVLTWIKHEFWFTWWGGHKEHADKVLQ